MELKTIEQHSNKRNNYLTVLSVPLYLLTSLDALIKKISWEQGSEKKNRLPNCD